MEVIRFHDNMDAMFKYDKMVREYEMIAYLNAAIRRYPLYAGLVTLTNVQNKLSTVRQEAAMAHKLEGERLLTLDNK